MSSVLMDADVNLLVLLQSHGTSYTFCNISYIQKGLYQYMQYLNVYSWLGSYIDSFLHINSTAQTSAHADPSFSRYITSMLCMALIISI